MNFQKYTYISTGNNKSTQVNGEIHTEKNRKFIAILSQLCFLSHEIEKKKNASEKNIFDFRCGVRFESDVTWNDLENC
jgi:hypothetical protein